MDSPLVSECLQRSRELLRENVTPHGFIAARREKKASARHYASIFGRDAAICALGALATGEEELLQAGWSSLRTLFLHQAASGQIPKYVKPEQGEADFWYSGCIDATLWWLLALGRYREAFPAHPALQEMEHGSLRAVQWLLCQEHPVWGLLQQNEASDWADIMPRSGFVLYTNALWLQVKRMYSLPRAELTADYANLLLHPFDEVVPEHRRARLLAHYVRRKAKRTPLYLSFLNFSFWGEEGDVFGNILAVLCGIAPPSRGCSIVGEIERLGGTRPYPVRVVAAPLALDNRLWRTYMERHRQNLPFQYHNGGIWPFVGGFWVLLLSRLGMREKGEQELARLAEANRIGGWEFNEWLQGETGEPMGMAGQTWNAALFLLAREELSSGRRIF